MTNGTEQNEVESNELELFVTSTLTAIMSGVANAQPEARVRSAFGTGEFAYSAPESVTFDVAVTAKHSAGRLGEG